MPDQVFLQNWQKACELIKDAINPLSYQTWIEGLRPIAYVEDTIYLEASTIFIRNMIHNRYLELIKNAFLSTMNAPCDVKITLPDSDVPELRKIAEREEMERRIQIEGEALHLPDGESGNLYEQPEQMLNPRYTFDTFVIGNSNRFAHAASLAVAEAPADSYNPLFLYGGVGLGKTHLLHAIGHMIIAENPSVKLLYITSENFTNALINAIKSNKNVEFRERFRNVDVLMIDDIQFLAGRTSTQEEFFHTFNSLHSAGKQIVISSDKPPKAIPTLEDRLRSRFEWGLIADIQRPDYETRIAILRKKAEQDDLPISDEVIHFIAEKIESNIRELEGSLTRVFAYARLSDQDVTIDIAKEALANIITIRESLRPTPEKVISTVASYYNTTPTDIKSPRRAREVSVPRQVAMYITRQLTEQSLPRIGEAFGGRDHTTVMHACDKVAAMMEKDSELKTTITNIMHSITGER